MVTLLWIDDERPAPPGWAWAQDAREALDVLRAGGVTYASLDHDLGHERHDGTWLVRQMIAHRAWPKFKPGVHSSNWQAAARMLWLIRTQGPYDEYALVNGARAGRAPRTEPKTWPVRRLARAARR